VISKYDLARFVDFDEVGYIEDVSKITRSRIIKTSRKNDLGFEELAFFLMHEREHLIGHSHHH
jgi:Ni2+-binding GTPase involved in maturation of urease and hydrogenase